MLSAKKINRSVLQLLTQITIIIFSQSPFPENNLDRNKTSYKIIDPNVIVLQKPFIKNINYEIKFV